MFRERPKTGSDRLYRLLLPGVVTLLTMPSLLFAVEEKPPQAAMLANPMGANQLANVTLGLLVVLGLIFALAWLFRRYGNIASFNRSNIQILGGVSLGPREKAILLEVEGEKLLVGVASGQVTRLHVFSKNDSVTIDDELESDSQGYQNKMAENSFSETLQHEKSRDGESST